jgi:localization factor PodJL
MAQARHTLLLGWCRGLGGLAGTDSVPCGHDMNRAVPWSIKGVDFDAREAAKEAARRSGMTLGEWLNSVIAEQAADLGVPVEEVDEVERLEAVASRLARMQGGQASAPRRSRPPEDEAPKPTRLRTPRRPIPVPAFDREERVKERATRDRRHLRDFDPDVLLEQAIEAFERGSRQHADRTNHALSRVVERLEDIEDRLEDRKSVGRGDARATIAKIQERLDDLTPRQPSWEPRRADPVSKAPPSPPASAPAPAPAPGPAPVENREDGIARLEAKLTTLIETLTEHRAAATPVAPPRRAPRTEGPAEPRLPIAPPPRPAGQASVTEAVAQIIRRQRELEGLGAKPVAAPDVPHASLWATPPALDPAHLRNSTAMASMPSAPAAGAANTPDFAALQKEIAGLSAKLEETRRDLIDREETRQKAAQEQAKTLAPSPEVAMLRRQIEDLSKGFAQLASRENMSSLDAAVRDLSQRVEVSRQGGIGESILRPVEELAADIRRSLANLPAASAFKAIESEIAGLRAGLDAMQAKEFDPRAFGELQSQTAEIRAMLSKALAQPVSLDSIERKISGLTDRVDLLARHGSNPIDSAAVIQSIGDIRGTLDAALGNGLLGQLATRMDALTQRLEAAALAPPAVDVLTARLDVLGRKIEDAVSQSQTSDHFDRLSQRLETVQRSLDGRPDLTPAKFDTSALEVMMRDLAQKLERPAEPAPVSDMRSVSALQAEITRLADQIERVSPVIDTSRIENMVLDLSSKLDRAGASTSDIQLAEALSRQIAELSARVDVSAHMPDRALAEELRDEMAALAQRIEAGQTKVDTRVIDEVRQQIALLSDRLQVGDESARVLASLETAVSDLFSRIDDMRDATLGAAESAARVAAREAVREVLDVQPNAPSASGEILSRELLDLRSMQDAADRRTHSTLTAVHETLEKIVERLAMLEDDFAEVRPDPLPPVSRPMPRMEDPGPSLASGPTPSFARAPAAPDQLPRAPTLGDLMEPGSGMPPSRRSSEPPLPDLPEADPQSSKQASFIAAARRAAQSAMSGKKGKAEKPKAETRDASLDAMFDARERAKAAHLAALSEAASVKKDKSSKQEGPASLGRVSAFIRDHRRAVFAGLACLATVLGTLQAIRLLRPAEDAQAVVEYSVPAAPSPAPPKLDVPKPPAAPTTDPQRQGALEVEPPKVAGNFVQAPIDLGQTQHFVATTPASDPVATNSISRTETPARMTLISAATAGQAPAQYELASRYADGRGVTKDAQQAQQWFEKAAQQNLAPAQFRLGAIYERGIGVGRDLQKAHDLYLRAANQGNIRAMHNLAVLSAEGVDGKPDYATAATWFQKAAEHGVRDSQYNLAILTARGLGVEQNLKQSWLWFALAAAQGDGDAEKKRDEVAGRLSVKDMASARIQFEAFRPKAPISASNEVASPTGGWDQLQPTAASSTRIDGKNERPSAAKPARGKVTSL